MDKIDADARSLIVDDVVSGSLINGIVTDCCGKRFVDGSGRGS
jgi:hypothetical protein